MGIQLFTNNASTTLAAAITSGATSCSVTGGSGALFPVVTSGSGNWFIATLQHIVSGAVTAYEIVKVTATSTDTFTIVRAQEGTSAAAWASGDTLALLLTAGTLAQFTQSSSGSFTGTLTGTTGPVSGTFNYSISGPTVTISSPSQISASSTSAGMTLTGMPAILAPANIGISLCTNLIDNGVSGLLGSAVYGEEEGVIILGVAKVNGSNIQTLNGNWTSSGTKGVAAGFVFRYSVL